MQLMRFYTFTLRKYGVYIFLLLLANIFFRSKKSFLQRNLLSYTFDYLAESEAGNFSEAAAPSSASACSDSRFRRCCHRRYRRRCVRDIDAWQYVRRPSRRFEKRCWLCRRRRSRCCYSHRLRQRRRRSSLPRHRSRFWGILAFRGEWRDLEPWMNIGVWRFWRKFCWTYVWLGFEVAFLKDVSPLCSSIKELNIRNLRSAVNC